MLKLWVYPTLNTLIAVSRVKSTNQHEWTKKEQFMKMRQKTRVRTPARVPFCLKMWLYQFQELFIFKWGTLSSQVIRVSLDVLKMCFAICFPSLVPMPWFSPKKSSHSRLVQMIQKLSAPTNQNNDNHVTQHDQSEPTILFPTRFNSWLG